MSETVGDISRLHALIIGVNKYQAPRENLRGCVEDATAVFNYFSNDLRVPRMQLKCLLDDEATRKGILDAFHSHLINNPNIKRSDPIVIYFAGHGDKVAAPAEWHSSDWQCEMILPHDASWSDVHEDVGNGILPEERKNFIHGIPDRTLGALISKLHQEKGDNITVILDSCFSGSCTRGEATARFSHSQHTIPANLDEKLRESLAFETPAKVQESPSTKRRGVFSPIAGTHTLLAACSSDEQALELPQFNRATRQKIFNGLFTLCLLKALRDCDLGTTSYSGVMHRVVNDVKNQLFKQDKESRTALGQKGVDSQTPQCEGGNQGRILFRTEFASSKSMLRIEQMEGGKYLVEAGSAIGIVVGTEFAVFPANMTPDSAPVAQLVASEVGPTKTILSAMEPGRMIAIPSNSYAEVIKYNDLPSGVRIQVAERSKFGEIWKKVFKSLDLLAINVIWTTLEEDSDFVLRHTEMGATIQSRVTVSAVPAPIRLLKTEEGENALTEILTAVIRFHFYLRRGNIDHPLRGQVGMKLFELKPSAPSSAEWGPRVYLPRDNPTDLFKENLVGTIVQLKADPEKRYGMKLSNTSEKDLFPYVLYYDLEDYSIGCLYGPPGRTTTPALARKVGDLPVGYGSSGMVPFQVETSSDSPQELGSFVMFVSTEWLDIAHMTQETPFQKKRSRMSLDSIVYAGVWDTVVVDVVLLKS